MKNTKAPWYTTGKSFNDQPQISSEETGRTIALCYSLGQPDGHSLGKPNRETTEAEANAHLIAAAPELLEACKNMVAWWNEWANSDNPTEIGDPDIYNAMKAINKAGGIS